MVSASSLVATLACLLVHSVFGRIYYDSNGTALSGDTLMQICQTNKPITTHFSKNVYATNNPVLDHDWTPLLFPQLYDQFDGGHTCGVGSKFTSFDTCAQIHSPMTRYHEQGDLKVSYVQEQYSAKWANLRNAEKPTYDSFLDNNMQFWVEDIGIYQKLWKEVGADMVYLKWENTHDDDDTTQYYSVITHNGDKTTGSTMTQYEIISDKFSNLDLIESGIHFVQSEQRAFFDKTMTTYKQLIANAGASLYPIGVSRAVTSVENNVNWYLKIFSHSITNEDIQVIWDESVDYNGNTVKYAHIKLYPSDESMAVAFYERTDDSTFGDFGVKEFESAITNIHNDNMISPFCGIDRWFDMHYAVEFNDITTSEKIMETMMNSGEKYTVYGQTTKTMIYMPEPNGQNVQLIFTIDDQLAFEVEPARWDPDWCPMECTDEMQTYDYGDAIATFTYRDDSTESSDSSSSASSSESSDSASSSSEDGASWLQKQSDVILGNENKNNQEKSGLKLVLAVGGIVLAVVAALMMMFEFYPNCKWMNKNADYQQIPN